MPQVPNTLVADQALPGPRMSGNAPIEAFGGGQEKTTEAFNQVIGAGQQLVEQEKKKADDVAATDAYAKTVALKNKLFWDPTDGAMTKSGKDAFGVVDEYGQKFKDGTDEIANGLSNDAQKAMYSQIQTREGNDLNDILQRHVFTESKKFQDDTVKAGVTAAQDDAVSNYQNPGKIADNIDLQKTIIMKNAAMNGWSPEQAQVAVEQAQSGTHRQVLERILANGDDEVASQYYKTIKDQMIGTDSIAVEKALDEGSIRGESQRTVNDMEARGLDFKSQIAEAKQISDPKLQDKVIERVKINQSLDDQARRDSDEKIALTAANLIDKGGSFDDLPPAQAAQLSPAMRTSLQRYSQDTIEGKFVATDPQVYYQLRTMLEDPAQRAKAIQYNLLQNVNDIEGGQLKSLMDLQAGLKNKNAATTKQLDGFQTDRDVVNGVLREANIPTKSGKNVSLPAAQFYEQVDKAVIAQEQKTGKKANNDDLRKISTDLMTKVITDRGTFWDTTKRKFELQPGENFEIDVPPTEAAKIKTKLQLRGIQPTDDNVMKIYKGAHGG